MQVTLLSALLIFKFPSWTPFVRAKTISAIPASIDGEYSFNVVTTPGSASGIISPLLRRSDDSSLGPRQELVCIPAGFVPCPQDPQICCSPGYRCCIAQDTCCPPDSNCWGIRTCCPKNAQTCGGRGCFKPGSVCCNGFACPMGWSCCSPGRCCPPGWRCIGNGYCQFLTGTTIQATESEDVEQTKTVSSKSTLTTIATRTTSITSTSVLSSVSASTAAMPTITFVYVAGVSDVLTANICLGMRKRKKQNLDVLTYDGPANKAKRRRDAGCVSGHCKYRQTGKTCDEYPFASTAEGGTGAQIACVPAFQNSLQGTYLNSWISLVGLKVGDQFGVKVSGIDCGTVVSIAPPLMSAKLETINVSGTDGMILPPFTFGDQTLNKVVLGLGDLDPGRYQLSVLTNGTVEAFVAHDNEGQEFARGGRGTSTNLTFFVSDPQFGVGLTSLTKNKMMNVVWNFDGVTNNMTTSVGRGFSTIPLNPLRVIPLAMFWPLVLHLF